MRDGCWQLRSSNLFETKVEARHIAGYTVIGTEFSTEMGLLLKLCNHRHRRGNEIFQARAGKLEEVIRKFDTAR